ncbi:MAG TPA: sulfite exporter TauE/SafE family protein [Nitrososphaerales archaeon]|nr:sulfite exporter TauE/SafE family protein [Nitrososphaerales archaeon]
MAVFELTLGIIIFFAVLSLAASVVNGGLGYGYSSLSTPLALLVFVNRILNPAYVLLEAGINTFMLVLAGKKNIVATFRRTVPVIVALVPGVIVGSLILNAVAPLWIRFAVYAVILPLILLQAAGFRRPLKGEATAAVPLGLGVGLLYSITTISGPPIALFWNNQGLKQREFKAAVAQVRIAESYLTCISYYLLGLFTASSVSLFKVIAPPVFIGIPIGMFIVSKVAVETFRRMAMTFDAGIVGYGLSATLPILFGISSTLSYALFVAVLALDLGLFYRYLRGRTSGVVREAGALETGQRLGGAAPVGSSGG